MWRVASLLEQHAEGRQMPCRAQADNAPRRQSREPESSAWTTRRQSPAHPRGSRIQADTTASACVRASVPNDQRHTGGINSGGVIQRGITHTEEGHDADDE